MSRKRSISSILDDDYEESSSSQTSNTSSRRRRNRSIASLIDEESISTSRPLTSRNTRSRFQDSQSSISDTFYQFGIQEETGEPSTSTSARQNIEHESDDEHQEDFDSTFLPRRRVRKYTNRPKSGINPSDDSEIEANQPSESSEFTTEEDEVTSESDDGESDDNGDFETFEDYAPPDYEPFRDPPSTESIDDDRFLWILIWIMSFRTRFNITESATEALIKFMKLVLTEIGGDDFNDFPNSMFLTKKALGIKDRFQHFVPCSKCHKLYQKQEVVNFRQDNMLTIMKCQHVEFPNSSIHKSRFCNILLSQKITVLTNRTVI